MADDESKRPIIIKKIKKGGHGHHGGAWKVAYADFVTAMMAFFLLLWLLGSTSEQQKKGLADYFSPVSVSMGSSGANGALSGKTLSSQGVKASDTSAMNPVPDVENLPPPSDSENEEESDGTAPPPTDEQLAEALAKKEQEQFEKAEKELKEAIQANPELKALEGSLMIDMTPEGMRIQIVDQENASMFPLGAAQMYPTTRNLLEKVAQVISKLPNKLSITGHTDSTGYANATSYDNWELSADRANASRRVLLAAGMDPNRFATIVGKADREHFIKDDPASPRNRRIAIVLLRENPFKGKLPPTTP